MCWALVMYLPWERFNGGDTGGLWWYFIFLLVNFRVL